MCEARHRTTCITDRYIRPDKLSHRAAHLTHFNGGWLSWEADVSPFIDIAILQTCLYLRDKWDIFVYMCVCLFICARVHTAVTWMNEKDCSMWDFSVTERIAHWGWSCFFTVWITDNIFSSDSRKILLVFYQFPLAYGKSKPLICSLAVSEIEILFFFFPKNSVLMGMLAQEIHLAVRSTKTPVTSWEEKIPFWLCVVPDTQMSTWRLWSCQKGLHSKVVTDICLTCQVREYCSLKISKIHLLKCQVKDNV